jgi:hypothetical protein
MIRCEECGFVGDDLSNADLVAAIAKFAKRYRPPVTRFLPGEDGLAIVRARPAAGVWSALEYVAHTRDALGFYRDRIARVLAEERPQLEAFGFEAAAEERGYNDEDPVAAADGLATASTDLSETLGRLDDAQWERVGVGSEGGDRTVRVLAGRAAHEGHHHLLDVGRSLRAAREQR